MGVVWGSLVAALAAGGGCATAPPVEAQGLALKKVVIYRNGVGYFERAGRVDTAQVRFRVRKNEIGDFLATLAVLERGGSAVRSASFPLEVEEDRPPRTATPKPEAEDEVRLDSVTLRRLIEEVRTEGAGVRGNYDRTYNRHNR